MTETSQEIQNKVREIKQSFRLLMNGVTAQSMREKGLDYHINWGANLLHLKDMATEYEPDHQLAQELWKENIRECKILATMLMPKDGFEQDLAMLWIEQTRTLEIAEIASMNLYCELPCASNMAFVLFASEEKMRQLHGFLIMARLFGKQMMPNERDVNEFIDQSLCALQTDDMMLRKAALNAIQRFAELDETCLLLAKGALKTIKMEDWV